MKEVFEFKEPSYRLHSQEFTLYAEMLKFLLRYSIQSIKYLATKTWDLVPD